MLARLDGLDCLLGGNSACENVYITCSDLYMDP